MRLRYPGLQNAIMDQEDPETHEIQPGAWREEVGLPDLANFPGRNCPQRAKEMQSYLVTYVNGIGRVEWQNDMI